MILFGKNAQHEIDMTNGNFFKKILIFCIPLVITGVLQMLYNTADLIVVGRFSGVENAVGAVGSTSSLISLIVNLFMGLSVGTNVICARAFAAKNEEQLSRAVHTSVTVSVLCGTFLGIIGFIFARFFLSLMDNPIDLAVKYLKIYFIGLPFNLLFNFAASILRGVGDTRRPLIYLTIAGVSNVVLNLFFVIVCKMDVDGVALATIIAQFISCVLVMRCLIKTKQAYGFSFKKIHIYKDELLEIVRIGLPAGVQGSIFSISNVIIQSTVNKFGATVVDGNAVAQSIEGFVYVSMQAVVNAALSFIGQNVGAKKYENIRKLVFLCLATVSMVGIIMGGTFYLLKRQMAGIYTTDKGSIEVACLRMNYLVLPYFVCGIMDVMVGVLRGLGKSFIPMIVSIVGVCGFRILWIYTIFYKFVDFSSTQSLHLLYASYIISWIITLTVHFICYKVEYKKLLKKENIVLE